MGFISTEWVSKRITTGTYGVAEVNLVASRPSSEFSKRHGLVMRIRAERAESGDHQVVHFDSQDLLDFFVYSVREVAAGLRSEIVTAMLGETSDDELLSALDAEVSRRRAKTG